jgi:uncharacterized protein YecT (DUF1311 family)
MSAAELGGQCCEEATQTEMNACSSSDWKGLEAKRSLAYQTLMNRLKGEPPEELLGDAERAWIAFRDKHCAFIASATEGGSVQPMILADCLANLTKIRLQQLNDQLTCQEGDLSCVGWQYPDNDERSGSSGVSR